jgi:hypothetical protein
MKSAQLLISLGVILTICSSRTRADAVYKLQSYADLQNGYALSGAITTDGTLGVLSRADITAWSYTISKGDIVDSHSSPGGDLLEQGLTATASQLTLPIGGFLWIAIPSYPGEGYSPELMYANPRRDNPMYFGYDAWLTAPAPNEPTIDVAWSEYTTDSGGILLGGEPWIIGLSAVPEPSALTLALLGGACVAVAQRTRRRRSLASLQSASPSART